jgi:hypothetical protein
MEALHCLLVDGVPHVVPQAEQLAEFFSCRPTSQTPRGLPEEERRARWREVVRAEAQEQARLFRDIVGNPFHYDPVPLERDLLLDPALLAWQGGRLEQLAEEIYRARHFERLPELAALLEAAGCSDAELVRHCRQPAGHVRGCWVVDLLLNKQ